MISRNGFRFRTAALVAAFALVCAGGAFAGGQDRVVKSFSVAPQGRLTLATDIGAVRLAGSDGQTVRVEIIREVRGAGEKRAQEIFDRMDMSFDQRGNDVEVRVKYDRDVLRNLFTNPFRRLRVEFVVSVPRVYNVDLKTSGGSVSVTGLEGHVKARTSGGSLTFEEIKGDVYGRTSGGSIRVGQADGPVDVHTSGGSIRIGRSAGRITARTSGGSITIVEAGDEVDAHTSGGSIVIEEVRGAVKAGTSGGSVRAYISKQPSGECSLTTSGGSVTAVLAEGLRVDVDARSSGGRVNTDFPVTIQGEIQRRSLQAKINGGGPLLRLRSSGGGVHIQKR